MWLKDLIEELQKVFEENGNIPVTVYADHGQTEMSCQGGTIEYIDPSSGEDAAAPDDLTGNEIKVFSLYGDGYDYRS